MLVLSRKKNESIVIGDDISIRVVAVRGNRVRIAIDAPEHIRIRRGELEFDFARREHLQSTKRDVEHHHDREANKECIGREINIPSGV